MPAYFIILLKRILQKRPARISLPLPSTNFLALGELPSPAKSKGWVPEIGPLLPCTSGKMVRIGANWCNFDKDARKQQSGYKSHVLMGLYESRVVVRIPQMPSFRTSSL